MDGADPEWEWGWKKNPEWGFGSGKSRIRSRGCVWLRVFLSGTDSNGQGAAGIGFHLKNIPEKKKKKKSKEIPHGAAGRKKPAGKSSPRVLPASPIACSEPRGSDGKEHGQDWEASGKNRI